MRTLSPAEVEEIRVGFHDTDVTHDMEHHWDEEPACIRGDAPATVRLVARCCGHVVLHCPTHHTRERDYITHSLNGLGTRCKTCFHEWVAPDTYGDFIREVYL